MILDAPRRWTHASPSQVSSFRRCRRRWWLEKVAGVSVPTSPAADLGRRVHAVAEAWLRTGALSGDPDAWRVFEPGIPLLPQPPLPPGCVEVWVGDPGACEPFPRNPTGIAIATPIIPVVGRLDLVYRDLSQLISGAIGTLPVPSTGIPGTVRVWDHKTKSDERWAETEEQLLTGAATAVYTRPFVAAGRRTTFGHVYYLTKGVPRAWIVEVEVDRRASDRAWSALLKDLERMRGLAAERNAARVPINRTACCDYGGCSYAARCRIIDGGNIVDQFEHGDGMDTLADRLKQIGREGLPSAGDAADRLRGEIAAEGLGVPGVDPTPPNPSDGTPRDVVSALDEKTKRGLRLPSGKLVSQATIAELGAFLGVDTTGGPDLVAARLGVDRNGRRKSELLKVAALARLTGDAPRRPAQPAPAPAATDLEPDLPVESEPEPNGGFARYQGQLLKIAIQPVGEELANLTADARVLATYVRAMIGGFARFEGLTNLDQLPDDQRGAWDAADRVLGRFGDRD